MPTLIYHITHVRNLPSILESNGLCTYNALRQMGNRYISVAHEGIQGRRRKIKVTCGSGGTLHDYVPFSFAPRAPMLFAIHRGNVVGYTEGQRPLIHLVSSVEVVQGVALPFVFTSGHAIMQPLEFFDDLTNLNRIDWEMVNSRYWPKTSDDPDRQRRKQAEFLVHGFFPWNLISEIGVIDPRMKSQVNALIQNAENQPQVNIHRGWYY